MVQTLVSENGKESSKSSKGSPELGQKLLLLSVGARIQQSNLDDTGMGILTFVNRETFNSSISCLIKRHRQCDIVEPAEKPMVALDSMSF